MATGDVGPADHRLPADLFDMTNVVMSCPGKSFFRLNGTLNNQCSREQPLFPRDCRQVPVRVCRAGWGWQ